MNPAPLIQVRSMTLTVVLITMLLCLSLNDAHGHLKRINNYTEISALDVVSPLRGRSHGQIYLRET